MPKARQTCTRCSQRRQKCDRKQPCKNSALCSSLLPDCRTGSRCVSKNEGHLCTTVWSEGYNATVHRRYPSKPSASKGAALSADEETSNLSPRAARGARTTNSTSGGTSPTLNILDGPERFSIGESRVVDISVGALLNDKDTPSSDSTLIDQGFKYVSTAGKFREEPRRLTTFLSLAAQEAEVRHIRGLLPTKHMLLTIVDYYGEHMLYWAGGIYHGLSFRKQLLDYLGDSSTIDPDTVDLRWMGLLCMYLRLPSCQVNIRNSASRH